MTVATTRSKDTRDPVGSLSCRSRLVSRFGDSPGIRIARIDAERALYRVRGFVQLSIDGKCASEHDQGLRIGGQERCRAAGMGYHFADLAALVDER